MTAEDDLLALVQTAAQAAVQRALRSTPVPSPMPGTVLNRLADGTVNVQLDNDLDGTGIAASDHTGFVYDPGARVMVLRYPPSGATIIGTLGSPKSVFIGNGSPQNIPNGLAVTTLTWTYGIALDSGGWDASNPTEIVMPWGGLALISVRIQWDAATSTSPRWCGVQITAAADGSTTNLLLDQRMAGTADGWGGTGTGFSLGVVSFVRAADRIEIQVAHNDAANPLHCIPIQFCVSRVP